MIKRSFFLSALLAMILLLFSSVKGYSQKLTAHTVAIDTNCNGFYDYLPKGYEKKKKRKKYPLLIMLHGLGELGNGETELSKVLRNEPMKLVANGTFPDSFVVNGREYQFIIFAPQFIRWPWPKTTQAVIDYAIAHYPVDKKRIYLTGLSMGGGATWECVGNSDAHAKKIAAIVPVCGASLADSIKAQRIAAANLPVWSLHNEGDRTVTVEFTRKYTRYINSAPIAPKEPAKETIFPEASHNAWRKAYDPLYKENGMNIYEWMLSHHR